LTNDRFRAFNLVENLGKGVTKAERRSPPPVESR